MFGLEKGDSVEWMQLEDREVWKKLTKKKWSIWVVVKSGEGVVILTRPQKYFQSSPHPEG